MPNTFYIDLDNGNNSFNGSQFAQPSVDEYLILFAGTCGSSSYTITPPANFTERLDTADADTSLTSFFADYPTYGDMALQDATISGTAAVKAASMIALKPQSTTPIAFVNTAVTGEADQSVDAAPPADIQDNDVMIAMVWAGCTSGSAAVITPPAGWGLICTVTVGSYTRMGIYWKRCASESGNYTFSHNNANTPKTQVAIIAYRNCITTGNPYDTSSNTQYTTSNTTMRAAALTITDVAGPFLTFAAITAALIAPGDTVKISKTGSITSIGTATWPSDGVTITLDDAVTQNIDMCESGWTKSANITDAYTTNGVKEGTYCMTLTPASGFTTGVMAYKQLPSELDLSGYTKLSFWWNASGDTAANVYRIDLCSDTGGTTPVNSFTINFATESTAGWTCFTFDNGSALGASIKSIAITALLDPGTVVTSWDNFIACNDLTLNSLIGLNTEGETWYPIQSINGTAIRLANDTDTSTGLRGYIGDGGASLDTYVINPKAFSTTARLSTTILLQSIPEGGTAAGGYITYEGGYNVSTGLVDGLTIWDGLNGYGYLFGAASYPFLKFKNLGATRINTFLTDNTDSYSLWFENCHVSACSGSGGFALNGGAYTFIDCCSVNNLQGGFYFASIFRCGNCTFKNCVANNNIVSGFTVTNHSRYINCIARNNLVNGFTSALSTVSQPKLYNCWTSDNDSGGLYFYFSTIIYAINCNFEDNIIPYQAAAGAQTETKVISINHGGVADTHKIYDMYSTIISETTTRHTASGIAWKFLPVTDARRCEQNPLKLTIATIAVNPGATPETITVTCYVYRSNTGINAKLFCLGGQLDGIVDDISDTANGNASEWEQLSIDVIPTEEGTFEVEMHVWGGTTYNVIVDDVTIAKA